MTYVLNMWNTYILTISPFGNRDKTTTNKWTYEKSHKSLNSYSLVEYNKIYLKTNSWKTLQEESLWQVEFDNLYFWNTLNKTHQEIFVWNRNNRLHTNNKKHVYKERKEPTHERVGEREIYINNIKEKISTMYVYKWSQDLMYKKTVSKKERKEKKRYIISSLHPSKRKR